MFNINKKVIPIYCSPLFLNEIKKDDFTIDFLNKIKNKFNTADFNEIIISKNTAIKKVLIDEEAKKILAKYPELIKKMSEIASEINLKKPGTMNFNAFETDLINKIGLATYLATDNNANKVLFISANPINKKIFKGLDFTISVITTEIGHGIFSYGGVGKYITDITPLLSEYCNVLLLGWDPLNKLVGQEKNYGKTLRLKGFFWPKPKGYETVKQAKKTSLEMIDYLQKEEDLKAVFFNVWYNSGAVPDFKRKHPTIPVFSIFHSVQPAKPFKAKDLGGEIGFKESCDMEKNYLDADAIITISEGNKKEIVSEYKKFYPDLDINIIEKKVQKILHGIHVNKIPKSDKTEFLALMQEYLKRYPKKDPALTAEENKVLNEKILTDLKNKKILLFVGRLAGQKGLDLLVDAIDKMKEPAILVAVATDPDNPDMKELAEKLLPKHPKIFWIPEFIKDPKKLDLIWTGADIFCCPSVNEPFGFVLVEANKANMPVVAFKDAGGPDEIIKEGVNGFLAKQKDTVGYAKILDRLVANKTELDQVRATSFKYFADHFDIRKNTATETFQLFFTEIMKKEQEKFEIKIADLKAQGVVKLKVNTEEFREKFGGLMQAKLLSENKIELNL